MLSVELNAYRSGRAMESYEAVLGPLVPALRGSTIQLMTWQERKGEGRMRTA